MINRSWHLWVSGAAVTLLLALIAHSAGASSESGGTPPSPDTMCEWEDWDFFTPNDYAHSTECSSKPSEGDQDDWRVIGTGRWTNAHSTWVYTKIIDEGGASHAVIP